MAPAAAASDMKLTPIRIRGKKARRSAGTDGRVSASPTPPASASSAPVPKRRRRVASPDGSQKKKPYVSFDQRLPLEVVESIYLLSQNVNLALCSRHLYWMLARRATRVEMALAAFSPAWDADWTRARPENQSSEPAGGDAAEAPGDPVFQTALLKCPWVDVPLLLDAEQLWMRRTFRRGGQDGGAVLAVPRKKHVVVRRSELAAAPLARELGINPEQATAIGKNHAAQGCADHHVYAWEDDPLAPPPNRHWEQRAWGRRVEDDDNAAAAASAAVSAAAPRRLPSAHACFAYEALNATFNLSIWKEEIDWEPDAGYWIAEPLCPLVPCCAKYRTVHPRTSIPERLLLADGAPAEDRDARMDLAALEASRTRLQRTYELLLWLVVGGARLQPTDSWEVTVDGHRRLLALAAADARAHNRRAPLVGSPGADPFSVRDAAEAAPAGTSAGAALPLRLSLDALCTSMLALYTELGVLKDQWPEAVLEDQISRPAEVGTLDDFYTESRAFQCMMEHFGPAARCTSTARTAIRFD